MIAAGGVLVDTSVWINHLRSGDPELARLLNEGRVLTHPFVLGEISCGSITNRREVLGLLHALPGVSVGGYDEVLAFVESRALYGRGVGWVDVHLLASALLEPVSLWTTDRALSSAASDLGIGHE